MTETSAGPAGSSAGDQGASSAYDNAGATIHITSGNAYTNDPVYVITGTAAGLGFPAVDTYDNGASNGSAGVYSGTWQSLVTPSPGDNIITAGPELGSGVVSDNSVDLVYEPGYLPNAVNVTIDQSGGNTNSATQTLSGSASSIGFGTRLVAGSTLTLSDNGTQIGQATVGADGTWAAQVTLPGSGHNTITASDLDLAGNSGQATVSLNYEAGAPAVAITSPGGSLSYDQSIQIISGTATAGEAGDMLTVFEDGKAIGTPTIYLNGTWDLGTVLTPGTHTFQATDTNQFGQSNSSNTVSFDLSTEPTPVTEPVPVAEPAPVTEPPPGSFTPLSVAFGPAPSTLAGTSATLTGSVQGGAGTRVDIFDGSTDLGTASIDASGDWTFTHDFGQGTYDELTAIASDGDGQGASASALFSLVTGVSGKRYTGEITTTDASGATTAITTMAADGSIGSQTVSNGDGSATATGYENGQTLFSIGDDVMTGNGYRENFVFQPLMGHARITDFVVSGSGHDTLTLSHQDFADIADLLAATTTNHGSAVIHVSLTDTIKLEGVTKAQLSLHTKDVAFSA